MIPGRVSSTVDMINNPRKERDKYSNRSIKMNV